MPMIAQRRQAEKLRNLWLNYMSIPLVIEQLMTWLDDFPPNVIIYAIKATARKRALLKGDMTLDAVLAYTSATMKHEMERQKKGHMTNSNNTTTNNTKHDDGLSMARAFLLAAWRDGVPDNDEEFEHVLGRICVHCGPGTVHRVRVLDRALQDPRFRHYSLANAYAVLERFEITGDVEKDAQRFLHDMWEAHIQQATVDTDTTLAGTTRALLKYGDAVTLQQIADEQ
jgi:hypothetical protein